MSDAIRCEVQVFTKPELLANRRQGVLVEEQRGEVSWAVDPGRAMDFTGFTDVDRTRRDGEIPTSVVPIGRTVTDRSERVLVVQHLPGLEILVGVEGDAALKR